MNLCVIGGIAGRGILFAAAAATSAVLILLLRRFLQRHALARPNARSSHREPTPQGGGIAVIAATLGTTTAFLLLINGMASANLWSVFAATAFLACVGAIDDIRVLEVLPRLLLQALAVIVVIAALPPELRIFHVLPWWIERALLLLGGLWFVNLVNFMDGIDWMTVAAVLPVTAGLALAGMLGALPAEATLVALALGGAIVGFAPFNRPVARLFLGDVGSLPIGLLVGWLLVQLAGNGHLAATLLLPLYYLADATITLFHRLVNGEQIMQAHRSHFYQRAMDRGFSVYQIVGRVFALNIALVLLATVTLLTASAGLHATMLTAGGVLVGVSLWNFSRVRR